MGPSDESSIEVTTRHSEAVLVMHILKFYNIVHNLQKVTDTQNCPTHYQPSPQIDPNTILLSPKMNPRVRLLVILIVVRAHL